MEMKIQQLKPSDLKPYFNNPRKNEDAVEKVAESIQAFGFKSPIIVDKNNVIIAGHTRLKAALKLGLEKIPVIVAKDLDEGKARAYRIADNRTSDFSYWDGEKLNRELEELDSELNFDWFDLFEEDDPEKFGADDFQNLNLGFEKGENHSIVVHFQTLEDLEKFGKIIEQKITPKTKYIWFPEKEIEHYGEVEFEES